MCPTGGASKNPDDIIKQRFADVGRVPQAFSSIKYVGTRTYARPTDFNCLKKAVKQNLSNNSVRSARSPDIIFKALMVGIEVSHHCVCESRFSRVECGML